MMSALDVPGTYNLRDVGGYRAAGGTVRSGRLFRGDALARLGKTGRAALSALGIGLVLDLRDDFEVSAMPDDVHGLALRAVHLPVFEGSGASRGMLGVSLAELYETIVTHHASVVAAGIAAIAASEEPVLVHCTAGKDRTGIVIALTLLAIGVPRDVVLEDYAASEPNLSGEWLSGMLELVTERGGVDSPELRVLLGGSPPEALAGALDIIEREHGTVRNYLFAAGLEETSLVRLRERLVKAS